MLSRAEVTRLIKRVSDGFAGHAMEHDRKCSAIPGAPPLAGAMFWNLEYGLPGGVKNTGDHACLDASIWREAGKQARARRWLSAGCLRIQSKSRNARNMRYFIHGTLPTF